MNLARLESSLKRYNYTVDNRANQLTITGGAGGVSETQVFFYYSIFAAVAGVLVLLFLSFYIGVVVLLSAVPLYIKGQRFNQIEKTTSAQTIQVSKDMIKINNKDGIFELDTSEIKSLNHNLERDSDITMGVLGVIMEDDEYYDLLRFMGNDRRYVEDDMTFVASEITGFLNEE